MRFTIFTFLIFFTAASFSYAACSGTSCSDVKLTRIYINATDTLIQTDGTEANLTNCVSSNGYIYLQNSHPNAEKIYAILLSAYSSDRSVQIRTDDTSGNTGNCTVSYVTIDN